MILFTAQLHKELLTQQEDGKVWSRGKKEARLTAGDKSWETAACVRAVERTARPATPARVCPTPAPKRGTQQILQNTDPGKSFIEMQPSNNLKLEDQSQD